VRARRLTSATAGYCIAGGGPSRRVAVPHPGAVIPAPIVLDGQRRAPGDAPLGEECQVSVLSPRLYHVTERRIKGGNAVGGAPQRGDSAQQMRVSS